MTVSRDAQGKVTFPPISNPGIFPPTCIIDYLFHFYRTTNLRQFSQPQTFPDEKLQFSVRNTKATSAANRSGIQSGGRGLSGRGGARAQELEAKSRRVAIQHAWPLFCYVWKTFASVDRSLHPEILLLILMTVFPISCLVYLMPIPLLVIIN
ncbi:uncharacterized protein BO87DRAFT_385400 [Aspergillus neoniger CBS 115656]|uniref:Uncharacterized protein n=1 Tax=Aspergillus neoniger (strain CBS 115656) TaxID=1448310 RepID=A0A318YNA1_ASPNB|nr:hypothetical protein BO87DRAFT_385400 [Aspergillus neoniger CBS 115656]PYH35716.1 hypothetical protein BO87DRAFT_385400 [Aspergillus neoniger CBS 115656]